MVKPDSFFMENKKYTIKVIDESTGDVLVEENGMTEVDCDFWRDSLKPVHMIGSEKPLMYEPHWVSLSIKAKRFQPHIDLRKGKSIDAKLAARQQFIQEQSEDSAMSKLPIIPKTLSHDEGAYGRCSAYGRYSKDPRILSINHHKKCDCGKANYYSGAFEKPTKDSIWNTEKNY